ncbi:hypothetical protein OK074_2730 [Actinobacteria bacterium OK074]|nr:hypothetical protein OK074_2730 [Actinobacteria bacterium OK074]
MAGELALEVLGTGVGVGCLVRALRAAVLDRRPRRAVREGEARAVRRGEVRGAGRQLFAESFGWFLASTLAFGLASAVGFSR